MKISFTIPGEPVGALRITQRQMRILRVASRKLSAEMTSLKERIQKYLAYKKAVRLLSNGKNIHRRPAQKIYLNTMIFFATHAHPDPGNVRKAVEDAIFDVDKYVAGTVDFDYDPENPRVEVEVLQ